MSYLSKGVLTAGMSSRNEPSVCVICSDTILATTHQLRSLDEAGDRIQACPSCGQVAVPLERFLSSYKRSPRRVTSTDQLGDTVLWRWRRGGGGPIDSTGEFQGAKLDVNQTPVTTRLKKVSVGATQQSRVLIITGKTMKWMIRKLTSSVGGSANLKVVSRKFVVDIQPHMMKNARTTIYSVCTEVDGGTKDGQVRVSYKADTIIGTAGQNMT